MVNKKEIKLKNMRLDTIFKFLNAIPYDNLLNQSKIYRKTGLALPYNLIFEKMGLIKRTKDWKDKRQVLVELTDFGYEFLKFVRKIKKNSDDSYG